MVRGERREKSLRSLLFSAADELVRPTRSRDLLFELSGNLARGIFSAKKLHFGSCLPPKVQFVQDPIRYLRQRVPHTPPTAAVRRSQSQ